MYLYEGIVQIVLGLTKLMSWQNILFQFFNLFIYLFFHFLYVTNFHLFTFI